MGAPTRFNNGVTNVLKTNPLGAMIQLDPTTMHTFFNDFDNYVAANWTVTETDAAATQALADGDGGLLLITNSGADDDLVSLQKVGESFLLESGKKAFFKARFKVSDATQSDFQIGLVVTDTTPFDATDGVYFQKDDGDANLDVYCRKNATTGSTSATAIATVANDTFLTVAWYYNGKDEVVYAVNDTVLGHLDGSSSYLPDTELTVSFSLQNGEAAAKTMTVDYIFVAKER